MSMMQGSYLAFYPYPGYRKSQSDKSNPGRVQIVVYTTKSFGLLHLHSYLKGFFFKYSSPTFEVNII